MAKVIWININEGGVGMQVEVLPTAGAPWMPYLEDKLVVVIDVLRATSTMVTALANGCQTIIPVLTQEEAMEKRLLLPDALLGGERGAVRIEGYDFGNSPFDYAPEKVGGKQIIMTTTNGTRAIQNVCAAPYVWMGSFLNMESIVKAIYKLFEREKSLSGIVVLCAGTEERFDLPDTLCAGMLVHLLGENVETNDLGNAARMLYRLSEHKLQEVVRNSEQGIRITGLGFEKDVYYCTTRNILPIVPAYNEGEIVWLTD